MAFSLLASIPTSVVSSVVAPAPAVAAETPANTQIRQGNTFYAYVGAGENLDVLFTKTGDASGAPGARITVRGPGGEERTCEVPTTAPNALVCDLSNLTSSVSGVWRIDFGLASGGPTADYFTWSINVQNGTTTIPGRVWTNKYVMSQGTGPARTNLNFTYVNREGFVYDARYTSFNGIDSVFTSNTAGATEAGTCTSAYTSYQLSDARYAAPENCGEPYKIFFQPPALDLPTTATYPGGATGWVLPELVLPELTGLTFAQDDPGTRSGTFTVNAAGFTGQLSVQIDVNNNGDYTDPKDVTLPLAITGGGQGTVQWDGLDGAGNPAPYNVEVPARAVITQAGEIHFVNNDVEYRDGGLQVTALNGPSAGSRTLYWNDTALAPVSCSTAPVRDATAGVDSTGGVHGWTCFEYGDVRVIDDWTYHSIDEQLAITLPNLAEPGISVVKRASEAPITAAGQTIEYSFDVTNTGNVTLSNITVVENKAAFTGTGDLSAVTCPTTTLAPNATVTCVATYTTTQADVDAGSITNEASVTGTPPGTNVPVTSVPDEAEVLIEREPAMTVVKSADEAAVENIAVGQEITYSFVVTNTGNVTLSNVSVADNEATFTGAGKLSAVTCPATAAASLAPQATMTCEATYTVVQADVDQGSIENSAIGTGTPPPGIPEVKVPSNEVSVPGNQAPALAIVKTASAEGVTRAGQQITYSFEITNTGNVTLRNVAVQDDAETFSGTGQLSEVVCPTTTLAPKATVTCEAIYTTTQDDVKAGVITNTATAVGTPPGTDTPPISSTPDDAEVTFPAQPGISLVKSADEAAQGDLVIGQEITYSFLVKNTGNLALEDVTVIDDEETFSGAGELSEITCPESAASLEPGAEIICTATYTVLQADVDAGFIDNAATATGTPARGEAPLSDPSEVQVPLVIDPELAIVKTASAGTVTRVNQVIEYSFLITNTGNVTLRDAVVVEGEFSGTGTLSEITCPEGAAALIPGQSVTCTASYTTTAADLVAGTLTNTATGSATIPGRGTLTSDPSTAEVAVDAPVVVVPEKPETVVAVVKQPTPPVKGSLANTGSTAGTIALGGLSVLLLGAGAIAASKLRRRDQEI